MNFPNLGIRIPTGWRGRGVLLLCGLVVSAVVCGFSFSSPDANQNGEVDTDLDGWADNVDSNPVSRAVFLWVS